MSQAKRLIGSLEISISVEFDDSMLPVSKYFGVFFVAQLTQELVAAQTFIRSCRVFNVRLLAFLTLLQSVKQNRLETGNFIRILDQLSSLGQ
jgi:hypothetical protein